MKKFIVILSGILLANINSSCENYLDVNDSPNNPQYTDIPPTLTLAAAQTQTFRAITGDARNIEGGIGTSNMNQLGNIWMNAWAGNSNNTTGAMADEYGVILNASFYDNIWDFTYRNVANLHIISQYNSENYDNHKAIAMILKAFYMQYIVDLYGDCPYSQAFLGQANLTPAYDDDKDVYRALVDLLDDAKTMIADADSNDATVGAEDTMMGGNMAKWVQFANTVKLRLLIRQSGLTDTDTQTYISNELDELASATYISDDVTINPGYNNSTQERQNPFYARYGYLISGAEATLRGYITATGHVAEVLNGNFTGTNPDPRRGRLFVLQSGAVVGINQGDDAVAAPNNPSFLGPAIAPVPVGTDSSVGSSMDGYVMTLSEAKFLLAEAALLYPSKFAGYDPQTLFNEGVTASFVRLGVASPTTAAASYLATVDLYDGYGWGGTSDKLKAIMTQKWIALMSVNAIESWIDFVRTGYPQKPLPSTNTTGLPKRLMYPTSEYVSNSANVPSQTAAQAFATGPFWLP